MIHSNEAVGPGGGIAVDFSAAAVISGCDLWGNTAGDGGGICVMATGALISGCVISGNTASFGGGISLMSATDVTVSETEILSNAATFVGGGVSCYASMATFIGCATAQNVSHGDGGAFWFYESQGVIARSAIRDNSADGTAGGIFVDRHSVLMVVNGELVGNDLAIHVDGEPDQIVEARHNWWGHASGPHHPEYNPLGFGDEVGDFVKFDPWDGTSDVAQPCTGVVLYRNTPNPFCGTTTIRFFLPAGADAELRVYDASGRLIVALLDGYCRPGVHTLVWDGRDSRGRRVPGGVCFFELGVAEIVWTRRAIVLQ